MKTETHSKTFLFLWVRQFPFHPNSVATLDILITAICRPRNMIFIYRRLVQPTLPLSEWEIVHLCVRMDSLIIHLIIILWWLGLRKLFSGGGLTEIIRSVPVAQCQGTASRVQGPHFDFSYWKRAEGSLFCWQTQLLVHVVLSDLGLFYFPLKNRPVSVWMGTGNT